MIEKSTYFQCLTTVLFTVILLDGCATFTVGGFLSQPKRIKINKDVIDSNSIIRITLTNGDKFLGRFKGFEKTSTAGYTEKLSTFNKKNELNVNLPMPGQRIMIKTVTNEISGATFIGFDPGIVEVKSDKAEAEEIQLTSIVEIKYGDSNSISGERLDEILRRIQIPLLSIIRIEWRNEELKIPLDIVKYAYKVRTINALGYSAFAIAALADFWIISSISK